MIAAYQPRRRSRMHRPVLVGEPEQLLECARRTRNGGCRGLVEGHARFSLFFVGGWPPGPPPPETHPLTRAGGDNFTTLPLCFIFNVLAAVHSGPLRHPP